MARGRKSTVKVAKKTNLKDDRAKEIDERKNALSTQISSLGFDASLFLTGMDLTIAKYKSKNKTNKQIRFYHYCNWAKRLKEREIGPEDCQYSYPREVLAYIRAILPNQIKGEIREDAFKVPIEDFCRAVLVSL